MVLLVDEKATVPGATPHLTVSTTPIAIPQKAAVLDGNSPNLSPLSVKEKSIEIQRGSNASTPRSYQASNPFDTDVEAMVPISTTERCLRKSTTCRREDCPVWPGQDHWKQKAKAAKMKRSCTCMARLSRRTRIMVKILIGFLIVGIAVGVGFGVSKPLGAPIWGKKPDDP